MARTKDFDETEVLTRAMNIFWTRGYNTTSMEDLVSGLGISRSSLYDTYTDKHTLFVKALENYQQLGAEKIQAIIDSQEPAKDTIKKLIELSINGMVGSKQKKGCLLMNAAVEVAPYDKEVSGLVCRNDQQMEEIFLQVIQRGRKTGEIKNTSDARSLARFILNTVKGLQANSKTVSDKSFMDEVVSLTLSTLDQKN